MNINEMRLLKMTLEQIRVSGKDDLSRLLGCIQFLEEKLKAPGGEEENGHAE